MSTIKIGVDALFLNKKYSGGKEQVLFNLLRGFQENGTGGDFHIFCYNHSFDYLKSLIPDASFTVLRYKNYLGKKTLTTCLIKTFMLGSWIRSQSIDVMFFPNYNTGFSGLQIPSAVLPHDIQAISHPGRFRPSIRLIHRTIYHFDFTLRTKIIAISDFDYREIVAHYPALQKKISLIYNPVAIPKIPKKGTSPHPRPYICAMNLSYNHKNGITLLKAFRKILPLLEHNLIIIGGINAQVQELQQFVRDNHLESRILFTGFLKEEDMLNILGHADLFVNPSLFEGFGLTSIEAALQEIPVLTSKDGAAFEVTMNLLRYYEPTEDADALAAKITEVLNNPPAPAELKSIRNAFDEKYSYLRISAAYYSMFKELLE